MSTKYQTTSVPTNTLKVGDVIIAHGGVFRVIEAKQYPADDDGERGPVQVNRCEFLGNASNDYECAIPKHWRDGRAADVGRPALDNFWNQQGNGLARTALVVAATEDAA